MGRVCRKKRLNSNAVPSVMAFIETENVVHLEHNSKCTWRVHNVVVQT
jgi:hypothetical protein